jgi:hypothetical protein
MTRQPHVSRGPYLPPEEPERDPDALAVCLLGLAALIALFVVLFVVVPLL